MISGFDRRADDDGAVFRCKLNDLRQFKTGNLGEHLLDAAGREECQHAGRGAGIVAPSMLRAARDVDRIARGENGNRPTEREDHFAFEDVEHLVLDMGMGRGCSAVAGNAFHNGELSIRLGGVNPDRQALAGNGVEPCLVLFEPDKWKGCDVDFRVHVFSFDI